MPKSGSRAGFSYPALLALVVMLGWGLVVSSGPLGAGSGPQTVRLTGIAAAPTPAVPAGLPAGIEALAGYVKQSSCDPVAKPGVVAFGRLLVSTYPGSGYGITRGCGLDGIASEHYEGRALDWMVSVHDPAGVARVNALVGWLFARDSAGHPFAMARRLGIMYVIWNGRIWGSYATSSGWRPYSTCAAHPQTSWDTSCHRDHVHFSFSWAGAMGSTSFWSGRVAAADYGPCRPADLNWAAPYTRPTRNPCPTFRTVTAPAGASATAQALARYSGAAISRGSTGPVVAAVQRAIGATPDGDFGPLTAAAVSAFRTAHRLPAGTTVDAATWRALLAAYVTGGQAAGSGTAGSGATGSGEAAAGSTSAAAGSALTRYKGTVLRYGARGAAVSAVQRALGVRPVSGWFGPVTRAAVVAFQRTHGIPTTGNVGPLTWAALGA